MIPVVFANSEPARLPGAQTPEPSQHWATLLATAIVGLAACTVTLSVLGFLAGGSVSKWSLPLSTVITGAGVFWWARRLRMSRSGLVAVMAATLAAVIIGAAIGGAILDSTFDGRWFHREAIIQLAHGWNPLAGELTPAEVSDDGARVRINGYPKGPWILAASLFMLVGLIEPASAFSFALVVAAAASVYAATVGLGGISVGRATAIAVVAALNPIAMCQLANPLVDGQLASVLLVVIAAGVLLYRTRSGLALTLLVMTVVFGVNTKQSAVPFVVVIVGGVLIIGMTVARRLPRWQPLAAVAAAFVFGLAVIGAQPHVTNVVRHGKWAYPHGAQTVTGSVPEVLEDTSLGRLEGFLRSSFSRSLHQHSLWSSRMQLATELELKLPFSISRQELRQFRIQGVRIGGGGPLYSAMLLTGLLALVMLLRSRRAGSGSTALLVSVLLLSVLLLSVVLFPYPWVFRLVPQAWLLPLVPAAAALTSRTRWTAATGWAVLVVGAVNLTLVTWVWTTAAIKHTSFLQKRLAALVAEQPVAIDFGGYRADRLLLADHGVRFIEVSDPQRWLGLYLGWAQPNPTVHGLPPAGGDPSLQVRWTPVRSATAYRVAVIAGAPVGPEGGTLTVWSRDVVGTETTVPWPSGGFAVTVAACNLLGRGPAVAHGGLKGTTEARARPLLGVPDSGDVLEPPVLLAWLPSQTVESHRLAVIDAENGERVIDIATTQQFHRAKLPPHRRWRVTVTAGANGDGPAAETVEFRTGPLHELTVFQPVDNAYLTEGTVVLSWVAVRGATAYEFLVMEPGARQPTARGVTSEPTARVVLQARDGPTVYSAIVRPCPAGAKCRSGRERGWGKWSTEAGTGAVNFTVVPTRGAPPIDR